MKHLKKVITTSPPKKPQPTQKNPQNEKNNTSLAFASLVELRIKKERRNEVHSGFVIHIAIVCCYSSIQKAAVICLITARFPARPSENENPPVLITKINQDSARG